MMVFRVSGGGCGTAAAAAPANEMFNFSHLYKHFNVQFNFNYFLLENYYFITHN